MVADCIFCHRKLVVLLLVAHFLLNFKELINKLGVQRRVYTAGKNKNFMDSFEKYNFRHVNEMQKMLDESHKIFIQAIKNGRGDRLNINDKETIFSGLPF